MKYLVNRETKEHKVATPLAESIIKGYPDFKDDWQLVEADPEGWIPWSGGECPLPDDAPYKTKSRAWRKGRLIARMDEPQTNYWAPDGDITAYRPILSETAEKVENYTAGLPHSAFWKTEQSVFDRLKSAIAASESIPGIIAEIDAMLPEGYCVAKVAK